MGILDIKRSASKPAKIVEANEEIKAIKAIDNIITDNKETNNKIELLSKDEAIKELYSKCYDIGSKNSKSILYHSVKYNKFEFVSSIKQLTSLIYKDYPVLKQYDLKSKKYYLDVEEDFFDILFFENKISDIIEEVNLFQEEAVKIERVDKILYLTTNEMIHREPIRFQIEEEVKEAILKDYKEHFKELDEVLLWNVSCRFSDSRRQSYLHLRLNAGFGKSFLKSIFIDLGLWNEIKYSDIKSPTGLRPSHFKNSIGAVLDEFTIFKQDFKDWTNKIAVEAKGASNIYVPIYGKIFLSAEVSKSFIDGVNDQISDRVNVISKDVGKLQERAVYQENEALYYNVVLNYVNDKVKEMIKYFNGLEVLEAQKIASRQLAKFYDKNKIKAEDLDTVIKRYFYNKVYELYDTDSYELKGFELDIKNNIVLQNDFIYIKQPKKTFELILKTADTDFYKKAQFRISQFESILKVEAKNHKVEKKATLSMKFELKKVIDENEKSLEPEIVYEEIDENEEIPF